MLSAPIDHRLISESNLGLKAGNLRIILRPSTRARRLILRLLNADTLELVLPRGVRLTQAADFLDKHAAWIREARERWATCPGGGERGLPSRIHLPAIEESWQVKGIFALGDKVRLLERSSGHLLELHGSIDRAHLWSALLQTWLKKKASLVLVPWLERIANQTGLHYRRVTVRLQRSRWGSCSCRQHINLNGRLLLVAPELVEYLLIHELCHTQELNHSGRFWRLVERHCPEYKTLDRKLNLASRELPQWSQFQGYR
ncbi:MAG: M48 family metallopeptidase [Verrucomicrobia bacterium]|nr:M48 family metallopeptidase [Verrucomicrobiota bacterium]